MAARCLIGATSRHGRGEGVGAGANFHHRGAGHARSTIRQLLRNQNRLIGCDVAGVPQAVLVPIEAIAAAGNQNLVLRLAEAAMRRIRCASFQLNRG